MSECQRVQIIPTEEGLRSTDERLDSVSVLNRIDPSPENLLFAIAQSDFLPSPVGRGCKSGNCLTQ